LVFYIFLNLNTAKLIYPLWILLCIKNIICKELCYCSSYIFSKNVLLCQFFLVICFLMQIYEKINKLILFPSSIPTPPPHIVFSIQNKEKIHFTHVFYILKPSNWLVLNKKIFKIYPNWISYWLGKLSYTMWKVFQKTIQMFLQ